MFRPEGAYFFSSREFSIDIIATLLLKKKLRSSIIFIDREIRKTDKLQRSEINLIVKIITFSPAAMNQNIEQIGAISYKRQAAATCRN